MKLSRMRMSPIFLTAACTSWLGASASAASSTRSQVELSTEYFLVPRVQDRPGLASVASVVSVPGPNRTISIFRGGQPARTNGPQSNPAQIPLLRQQPWALPLAALSAAAMIFMAGFEVFVLLKARAAVPSRRHLFLGQVLLLGLFLLAGLSAAPSLAPNPMSCGALRLVGLPAALVFAALLVKCVFLLSLNSGVYLPAPYQALVLVFAVLVQVAIVGQWFYGTPPSTVLDSGSTSTADQPNSLHGALISSPVSSTSSSTSSSSILPVDHVTLHNCCCGTPVGHLVASLGYASLLLVSVGGLAIRARGLRDNNGEAAFIGLAVGASLPVWVSGGVGALTAPEEDREAWLAYALLATSLLIFLLMFLPKGRQLAALGRENNATIARGDRDPRDDGLSSLPASGYSPSFFHFKPPNDTLESKMPCHQSTDRVALVSSGMPSCNACRCSANPLYPEDMRGHVETFVLPPGMYLRPEDSGNLYTTLSANPNVFFQRAAHPGMMY